MKKVLFWLSFPIYVVLMIVIGIPHGILDWLAEGLYEYGRKWEEWCYDWKNLYPSMDYKGDGVWSSKTLIPTKVKKDYEQ